MLNQLGDERSNGALTTAFRAERPIETQAPSSPQPVEGPAEQPTTLSDELSSEVPDSITPLITALRDPVAEVRLAAAEALGKVGDASVVPTLSQALLDSDSRVRAAVARSLGVVGAKHKT